MPSLKVLELSFNHFTEAKFDAVPATLQSLFLFNNRLTGALRQLGSLATGYMELKLLDVRYNNLTGPLPQDLTPDLSILKMSHNAFTSILPSS